MIIHEHKSSNRNIYIPMLNYTSVLDKNGENAIETVASVISVGNYISHY